jgi:RNA polymerase sigma factor (TIGR02999 family)
MRHNQRIARLLHEVRAGGIDARDRLAELIYVRLKRLAAAQMRRERHNNTFQTTALAHEAYLRLVSADVDWQSRAHFFAIAARMMRRILVDYAKQQNAVKRGGGLEVVQIGDVDHPTNSRPVEFQALDEALERLEGFSGRQAQIVEMKFFGGMSHEEIGEVLGIHERTVNRDWASAKAWLYGELNR